MGNILYINTSDTDKVKITIDINSKKYTKISKSKKLRSQTTLISIKNLLKQNKLSLKDLSEVRVRRGPGSFTGLRVGIAIANSLSMLLKIPVNNKRVGDLETPVYN